MTDIFEQGRRASWSLFSGLRARVRLFRLRRKYLVRLGGRSHTPYRGVVVGLKRVHWRAFRSAFPEFELVFARGGVPPEVLVSEIGCGHAALVWFGGGARRAVEAVVRETAVPVIYVDWAPLPAFNASRGFLADEGAPWRHRPERSDLQALLDHFDIRSRPKLRADGEQLARSLEIRLETPAGRPLVVLPAEAVEVSRRPDLRRAALIRAADEYFGSGRYDLFEVGPEAPDHPLSIVKAFEAEIARRAVVFTGDSPLGLRALAAGREVVLAKAPFYAGYGLTTDLTVVARPRQLSLPDLLAIVVLIASRYVDADGRLIDPLSAKRGGAE